MQIQLSRNIYSAKSEAAEEVKGGIASLNLRRLRDVWERDRSEESPMRRGRAISEVMVAWKELWPHQMQ